MEKISIRQSKLGEHVSIGVSPIISYGMEGIFYYLGGYKETGQKIEINVDFIKDEEIYKEFQKKIVALVNEYTYETK